MEASVKSQRFFGLWRNFDFYSGKSKSFLAGRQKAQKLDGHDKKQDQHRAHYRTTHNRLTILETNHLTTTNAFTSAY